jgi:AcrR family transcriptional regulator
MDKATDTEQKILDAAKLIFQKKGMAGARMQEIADEAGINKALLHYYFRSKDKLFRKVFEEIVQKFLTPIIAEMNSEKPLEVKIWTFAEGYMNMLSVNPHIPLFMMHELNRNPEALQEIAHKNINLNGALLQSQINEEVAKGNFKPISFLELIVNILSLSVFPFVAKPMLKAVFGMPDEKFDQLIEERKTTIPKLIIAGLKSE